MLRCAAYSYRRHNAWEGHAAPSAAQDMMHNVQGTPLFVSEMLLLQQTNGDSTHTLPTDPSLHEWRSGNMRLYGGSLAHTQSRVNVLEKPMQPT